MKNKTKFIAFFLLSFVFISESWAENINVRDPYKHFFNETWGDFPEELQNAKEAGKKGILIFFEMDECPFCHYMKKNVLNQPKVQDFYRKHFLNFVIDIEGDVEIVNLKGKAVKQKDLAKKYRVRATPVIAYFNLEGKLIYRHTGKTSGVDEFMWLGEFIANEVYKKKIRFSHYKKQKRAEKKNK
ncbi:MAG: thioredoxin family protein [Gammaproteobacteria bacterium]|nr:thioredoxin family protein [Gammaproteobacteria bacterium]